MTIDYAKAKREGPRLKAALTRATKKTDPERRFIEVKAACLQAVATWADWGAWPDGWRHWESALEDAYFNLRRNPDGALHPIPEQVPRLEEL